MPFAVAFKKASWFHSGSQQHLYGGQQQNEKNKVLQRCGGSFRGQVRMPKCQVKNAQALASIKKKQQMEKKKGKNCTSLSYSEKQAGSALLCNRSFLNGHGRLGFGRVSSVPH